MIKILIGGAVLAACFYFGMGLDRYYRIRKEILEEYLAFLRYAQREISYLQRELEGIIHAFVDGKKSVFCTCLNAYLAAMQAGTAWKLESPYLEEGDKRCITSCLSGLSSMDYVSYQQVMGNAIAQGEGMLQKACKAKKEKGELYRKLAILIGVGFLILIV